jgi:hypothetical protein
MDAPVQTFHEQSVIWGQAYEVMVKRGVISCLIERKLLTPEHPSLQAWSKLRLLDLTSAVVDSLDILDTTARDVVTSQVRQMALTAFGVGYTATREYLRAIDAQARSAKRPLQLRSLWCPLALPGASGFSEEQQAANRQAFAAAFGLGEPIDSRWSHKGYPANADFVAWFSGPKSDFLLVQEYSFDMVGEVADFREQGAHLDELQRYRRRVDSRSVFARVSAEVTGESFELSSDIRRYFSALTSDNKPLFKLCQAASYAETTVELLRSRGLLQPRCMARALAITPHGLESLAAAFEDGKAPEPRVGLMSQLATAYRQARKVGDGNQAALAEQAETLFKGMLNKLPKGLRDGMKPLRALPEPGEDYRFEFEEKLEDFANPTDQIAIEAALQDVEQTQALESYFEEPAHVALRRTMKELAGDEDTLSLRDLHAAGVIAGLNCAQPGRLNVLALEGNPGIGKTTALRRYLAKKPEGYLFLYVSPRVVINRDVSEGMARHEKSRLPTGILTVTTNAPLIAAAERWHKKQVEEGLDTPRKIEGAVVADGVEGLVKPRGSMLVLTPEEEAAIDEQFAGAGVVKDTLSEHEDMVRDRRVMGVLKGMASTAKELIELNQDVNRVVLTAALQGFRERENDKTTIDALSSLFASDVKRPAGVRERAAFAGRIPNIVVMVDELAGDGAGAKFVHTIAKWLDEQFIDCFDDKSPFTVTLVVSDASLGNETVLDRYLNAGNRSPDKVLVSKSRGNKAFGVTATDVRIGGVPRLTLHVMTNSFPATELSMHYKVNLTAVQLTESMREKTLGQLMTPREAIRAAADEAVLDAACAEIERALGAGAKQVIYFAQDKLFLSALQTKLRSSPSAKLARNEVQVLDSSVPGPKRKQLVTPEVRDQVKVFLMTSSGARGVSFPLTDWIIASVPRFNVEAALMEIAQLIYRGRGTYVDEDGVTRSGDRVPRHLVMLVNDYVIWEDEFDPRQWLRQSLDLMTLVVMLRSSLITRIKGDAGLAQKLAVVPVGAVGSEELISLMSQFVSQFVREAEVFKARGEDRELVGLVTRASTYVQEIFGRSQLNGVARRGEDGRSIVKASCAEDLCRDVAGGMAPLIAYQEEGTTLAEHQFFSGPAVVETWSGFDKQEVFAFEGHETQLAKASRDLMGALRAIDGERSLAPVIRRPAVNLLKLLQRSAHDSANEFRTLKELKSPNTWVAVPAGYATFVNAAESAGEVFRTDDPALWQEALAKTLNAGSAVLPPLPRYSSFPWAAGVGEVSPLKLDLVFDDRYFQASSELNLLNTLLLSSAEEV